MNRVDGSLINDLKSQSLAEIVTKNFKAAAVFERFKLDFCCRGGRQLSEACAEKSIDPDLVANEILKESSSDQTSDKNFEEWKPDFLADYIVNVHHSYVRKMIPVIAAHAEKVASVHGDNHPETIEIAKKFTVVYKDLKQHMMKEEEILFPYVKYLVRTTSNNQKAERPFFGNAENPIRMMEAEHQSAGDELYEIRELSNNYIPPADSCNTFKVYYQELKEFEEDLHKHIHLENNILFPKTIELEKSVLYI